MTSTSPTIVHASTVALNHRAVLILGPAGSGKSSMALRLITFGATLVADDRTELTPQDGQLIASAPAPIRGLIEARGIGVLQTRIAGPTPIFLAVDLGQDERQRLPDPKTTQLCDITVPCLHRVDGPQFADAILLCLKEGIFPGL